MREYRLVYSSPCGADRLRKTGYVYGRIHVRVPPISARTGKAMLHPFSDGPAHRASLAGISGVDVLHGDTDTLGLVGNKVLQLPECPTMQASANALACPDAITDMRQIFHADFSHVQSVRFLNDGLGYFVVDVFDMPPLPTRDSPQFPLGGTATVGLETTTMGKVFVPFKTQLPATKDLATTCGGEIVLSYIHPQDTAVFHRGDIGDVQNQIKEPLPFTAYQLRFFGRPRLHQVGLMFSTGKRYQLSARHGEQRNSALTQGIGAMVVMHRAPVKADGRNCFVLGYFLVGLKRFVGASNSVDGVTSHLAPQRGKLVPNSAIGEMVQGNPVPASVLHGKWHDPRAGLRERGRKLRQFHSLHGGGNQFQGHSAFHIGNGTLTKIALQQGDAGTGAARAAALSLLGMNAGVSRATG